MLMQQFDVLIVGGGPAGAWAGYRLARSGARVAIVDGSHPREKPCGGGVTGRALALVRPAIERVSFPFVEIAGATFTHGSREARVTLDRDGSNDPPIVVAGRREFDGMLLSAAVDAGAVLLPVRATAVSRNEHGWTVHTRQAAYSAPWLLGADGANSLVRRHVMRPFTRAELSIGTGYFVRDESSRDIVVAFENDPPGYLWSFPRPDHLAVGICAQADKATAPGLLAAVGRWVAWQFGRDASLERYSWPIPSLDEAAVAREQPAGDRWMLVGDAAGLVDPITREGIYFALQSADAAADALASADSGETYAEWVRSEIHPELIRAARLKARLFQPAFMDLLVAALGRSSRIRAIMADLVAGRQSYHGLRRRLLRTFELKLMLELFGS